MEKYLYLALIFLICSYLSPKNEYKKYFQFILGVFLSVMIMQPLVKQKDLQLDLSGLTKKIEEVEYETGQDETAFIKAFEFEED